MGKEERRLIRVLKAFYNACLKFSPSLSLKLWWKIKKHPATCRSFYTCSSQARRCISGTGGSSCFRKTQSRTSSQPQAITTLLGGLSPVTRSKTMATAAFANRGVASNTNATKLSFDKSQSVSASASHEVKKEDGKRSEKAHSVYEDSLLTNLSLHHPSRLASDVMATGTTTLVKQLATMARVIVKLTKTVKEKDLQIAALMNKLEV
ncbi:hypothetical protein Acr_28g0007890 [Actinidia rufa]|uniref:Uncharacterized protein n=1 Tax=Actinidia rufa TaxID=165716 RepID=A0A7J0HBE3_9ERIC|nr:hypothetical protein Acr_28g0007890 [Actinidia rufa]